jgi:hypothetical protein
MRAFIEASLVLMISIVLTLLIMAVIFPRHALGGGKPAVDFPRIWPAVFIYGIHDRPGTGGGPLAPRFADRTESTGCPYLAALAAASMCPAAPQRDAGMTCPYLMKLRQQALEAKSPPVAPRGQHT